MLEIIHITLLVTILLILISQKEQNRTKRNRGALVLDSSALIDGRIVDVAKAGFAPDRLIVPRFIVHELQLLADGGDAHKRERARFGLDMVSVLQEELTDRVIITEDDFPAEKATDDKLVRMAVKVSGDLCTTDYNLNKVAKIAGVRVLNLNELAQSVRPVALPGEKQTVKIVQKGSSKDQGVGYLEDGTMVVVSGAGHMIGKKVEVSVTRMLQTEAGKMMFAKRASTINSRPSKPNN